MRAALVIKKDDVYWGFGTASDLNCLNLDMTPSEEIALRDYAETLFRGELRAYKDVLRYQKTVKEIAEKNNCEIHTAFLDQFNFDALRNMQEWVIKLTPMKKLVGEHSSIICSNDFWEDAARAIIGTRDPDGVEKSVQHMKDTYKPFHLTYDSDCQYCTMSDYFIYD